MSGGSYDYLYCNNAEAFCEETHHFEDLIRMRDRLTELKAWDAAAATEEVRYQLVKHLRYNEQEMRRIDALIAGLREVWKAVEWRDSSDWGDESLFQALHGYRGSPPCDHPKWSELHPGGFRWCMDCGKVERK